MHHGPVTRGDQITIATLLDDLDTDRGPDPAERRAVRRRVLAGILQSVRVARGWSVNDAASQAHLAPMTWRRAEEGLEVRRRSLAALDRLLGEQPGTTQRAIDDDLTMLDLVRRRGIDVSGVAPADAANFLDQLAERFRTGTVVAHHPTPGARWPAVGDSIRRALEAAAQHVPAVQPTDLQLVNRLIEQLTRSAVKTPAVRDLIAAAARAVPDLIASELADCERDLANSKDRDDAPAR